MRSRWDAFQEYATYTLLLFVLLNFVVFRNVGGLDMAAEATLSLGLAALLGYLVFDYSAAHVPGRPRS